MRGKDNLPLLLLDNSNMMTVLNEGEFKCANLTFDEVNHLLKIYSEKEVLRCFSDTEIENIIFNYLKAERKTYTYKKIRNMRPGQDALVFKLYITPSKTQPVIKADDGVEAKKIQNIYVYCQYLTRVK